MKILIEYTVPESEIVASRDKYHEGKALSDAVVFADDLQNHAHNGEGCLYGHFKVLAVYCKPVVPQTE